MECDGSLVLPFPNGGHTESAKFLRHYFDLAEHLPDDLSRIMSRFKESDKKAHDLLDEIDDLSKQSGSNAKTLEKLKVYQEIKDEKIKLAKQINAIVVGNVEQLSEQKVKSQIEIIRYKENSITPSTSTRRESIEDTPSRYDSPDEDRWIRSNKIKKALIFEDMSRDSSTSDSECSDVIEVFSGEEAPEVIQDIPRKSQSASPPATGSPNWSNLWMLVDVACERSAEEEKLSKKEMARNRKLTKAGTSKKIQKTNEDKTAKIEIIESDDESDEEETAKSRKKPLKNKNRKASDSVLKYCICNKPSFGRMVACDDHDCPIEWFHFNCVRVKKIPKGEW